MFEQLQKASISDSIPAAQAVIAILRYSELIPDGRPDLREEVRGKVIARLAGNTRELAVGLVRDIEQHEAKLLAVMTRSNFNAYVRTLGELARKLSEQEVATNKNRGNWLLQRMRASSKAYRIFVSHAFTENVAYRQLILSLETVPNFSFASYNLPGLEGSARPEAVRARLKEQIRRAGIVLLLGGTAVAKSKWVSFELDAATEMNIPIVAVVAPGEKQRLPREMLSAAKEVVGWNASAIVDAVRRHAGP